MVKQYAIIGKPVSHSLSPMIHAAAYRALELDWTYSAVEVSEAELEEFLSSQDSISGFSVTMPLKRALYSLGQQLEWKRDENSEALKASNTLVRVDGTSLLFNTDVFGARSAIEQSDLAVVDNLAILGSGATACSTALGAMQVFPSITDFKVFSRSRENAAPLLEQIERNSSDDAQIQWLPLQAAEDFGGADLTINTLPADVAREITVDIPLSGGWVFDVNYAKSTTDFSSAWPEALRIDGKEMLLWQAVAQIRAFLNGNIESELPVEPEVVQAMRSVLL